MPRLLVACEYSGRVRDAFTARGWDTWSCDLLPSESATGNHYQGPVEDLLDQHWDLLIAHPPCTHLAVSGARWFKDKQLEQQQALDFVRLLLNAPVERIALENPVSIISSRIRKPNQVIHPWMFGHAEAKATCLWLKNLPTLVPTDVVAKPASGHWDNQTPSGQNKLGPSPDCWKERSRTYTGIAEAMASQWG
jgi:site-specific DNA-cytosine methylase